MQGIRIYKGRPDLFQKWLKKLMKDYKIVSMIVMRYDTNDSAQPLNLYPTEIMVIYV